MRSLPFLLLSPAYTYDSSTGEILDVIQKPPHFSVIEEFGKQLEQGLMNRFRDGLPEQERKFVKWTDNPDRYGEDADD